MERRSKFQVNWLAMDEFKSWIQAVERDEYRAKCKVCGKTFDVSNMGSAAVRSHMKGKIHLQKMKLFLETLSQSSSVASYFKCKSSQPGEGSSSSHFVSVDEKQCSASEKPSTSGSLSVTENILQQHVSREDMCKSELLWAMKVVKSKYSYNSCSDIGDLFRAMFPDSALAQKFKCGPTKLSYIICYGLGEYFLENLVNSVCRSPAFVVSFDECLNKVSQSEQMDMVVRYWNTDENVVKSQYLGSQFLGHTTAEDLLQAFLKGTEKLPLNKLIQVSMDGPRVNWKLLNLLRGHIGEDSPALLDIGSCGLHTLHGAFRVACESTDWDLGSVLTSLWRLFKDSPAKREDFVSVTGCEKFPLKFCAHRWLEDAVVAERALEMWPSVETYIKSMSGKSSEPKSNAFQCLKVACADSLMQCKFHFFVFVTSLLRPLLQRYQSDEPLVPFLAKDLYEVGMKVARIIIQKSVLGTLSSAPKLSQFTPSKSNMVSASNVDLGFATSQSLRSACKERNVTEREKLQFRVECQTFLCKLLLYVIQKSPLKYRLVRDLTCLDPDSVSSIKFRGVLQSLLEKKWATPKECDQLFVLYGKFTQQFKDALAGYKLDPERLDCFYTKLLDGSEEFKDLLLIIKKLLVLSHGQAAVERGYSINKDLLVENMKEKSLVGLRLVYDNISHKDLTSINITKEMLHHAFHARQRYMAELEKIKTVERESQVQSKRKETSENVQQLQRKKRKLMETSEALESEANQLAHEAEQKSCFTLLTKSNAIRRAASLKKKEIMSIDEEITQLHTQLKNL